MYIYLIIIAGQKEFLFDIFQLRERNQKDSKRWRDAHKCLSNNFLILNFTSTHNHCLNK